MSVADARQLLVDAFPSSATRAGIFQAFEDFAAALASNGVSGEIWLDGSLLTVKADPGDGDFTLIAAPGAISLLPRDLAFALSRPGGAEFPGPLHAFCVWLYPPGHALEHLNARGIAYWRNWWATDREGNPKGFATFSIGMGLT